MRCRLSRSRSRATVASASISKPPTRRRVSAHAPPNNLEPPMHRIVCALAFALGAANLSWAAPPTGYTAKATVGAPTRLDWTFAVSNQSLADPPAKLTGDGFDSAKQTYELFVPERKDPKKPAPAILFISAGDEPSGWKAFEKTCKDNGFVFIGVRGAGNNVPPP